jgi:hypothetical protein
MFQDESVVSVMKSLKIIILTPLLLIALAASYLALTNYQCKQYLQGVSDYDLQTKEGVTLLKSTGNLYTGKAYATVCGGECGFMSCALLHWRAEYKEGKLHGEFDAPLSGIGDKHWFNPGDETETYIYENGTRIK